MHHAMSVTMWIKGTAWKARMQLGNLENLFKSQCFFFFRLFQAVSENSLCCQDLIVSVLFCCKKPWEITVFFCLWCHQFQEITIWPTPWRGFCGHQDIDPGGVFAEGQRAEEGWKSLEDGRNGVLNWYWMNWYLNWYELCFLYMDPPHKKHSPIKLVSLVYGVWAMVRLMANRAFLQGLSSMTADQIADVEVQKLPFGGLRNAKTKQQFFLRHIVTV